MTFPARPTREPPPTLFETAQTWEEHWWGMPAYSMSDATPTRRVMINFMTEEDVVKFSEQTGIPLTPRSDSAWYPPQAPLRGQYRYNGRPVPTRYPICIPSKGRAQYMTTPRLLDRMGVDYRVFVEKTEADAYRAVLGEERVVVMPFADLGQGSIPARNFIWDWAVERGAARHWVLDDNIQLFARMNNNRRLSVFGGGFFAALETFADRYTNLALIGPHGKGFANDRSPQSPLVWNTRVYSCSLIDTALPLRWRGRYNEDTDLCLRALKMGWCTAVTRSLLHQKAVTAGAKGKAMPGGNTDNVYNTGDHRRAFAESLREQHPDVVEVVWKFNRWHHEVNYRPFAGNRPVMRPGITPTKAVNDFGMYLEAADPKDASPDLDDSADDS